MPSLFEYIYLGKWLHVAFALFCLFKEPFPDNFGIYGINVCAMNNTHTHTYIYIKWWVFDRSTGQLSWTHAAKQLMSIHENFCAFLENRSLIRQILELSVISPEWNDNWFEGERCGWILNRMACVCQGKRIFIYDIFIDKRI